MTAREPGVSDMHIHIQPWRQLKPHVAEVMWRGKEAHRDRLLALVQTVVPKASGGAEALVVELNRFLLASEEVRDDG